MSITIPPRTELDPAYTWDTTSIFPDQASWEAEVLALGEAIAGLAKAEGTLASSSSILADFWQYVDSVAIRVGRVYMHAALYHYPETTNSAGVSMIGKAMGVVSRYQAAIAFVEPELIAIGRPKLDTWQKQEKRLAVFEQYLDNLFRLQKHVRSAEVEQVLGMVMEPFSGTDSTIRMFLDSELPFANAIDKTGTSKQVVQGNVETFASDPDRDLRESAYQSYTDAHLAYKSTLAGNLITSIKQGVFISRVRGYNSTLDMALAQYNIPQSVYDNLLTTFESKLPVWHRYWRVKRKALKLKQLRPFDTWAPLTNEKQHIPYAEAVQTICAGLSPLGEEYVRIAREGMTSARWVDVYPNQGKSSGAFSSGVYSTAPYILMSYDDTFQSLSTLAHELGHSMHSFLTNRTQPYIYSNYSIFVAEVASNFNQAMVRDYLLKNNPDPVFQLQVIEEAMYNIHRYFFQMPTLARFEREVHQRIEAGEGLTAEDLNETMYRYFAQGYGGEMELDKDRVGITWATFGHLYAHFYVYQYATGISAAHALAKKVLTGSPQARDAYLGFLGAGCSDYPIEVLKKAGADLSSPEVVEAGFAVLEGYVDRLEALVG